MNAYHVLIGGDSRLLSTGFDITAKGPEDATPEQLRLMLRQLLAERFRLRIHTEVRSTHFTSFKWRVKGSLVLTCVRQRTIVARSEPPE